MLAIARQGVGVHAPLAIQAGWAVRAPLGAAWQAGLLGERAASVEVLRGARARRRAMHVLRGVQPGAEVGAE